MSHISIRTIPANLAYFCVAAKQIGRLLCRGCRSPLDIHQPNPNQPDQFLGTCPHCGSWFRIEARAGEARAMVIRLPEFREIRPDRPAADDPS